VLSAVGAYAISNSAADVYWMLGFGVVGYFMKMYGYQVGPVILGMILGPLMDRSYRQAMMSANEDVLVFASEFFTAPLSLVILLALTFTIVSQTNAYKRWRAARAR
jgi:putative tricarboxylic transport membrane protein